MFKTYVNASAGVGGPSGMGPITAPSVGKTANTGWTPSVLYMIALVIAEIFLVHYITTKL